jgi:putative flavoprotein involved in K+ transport
MTTVSSAGQDEYIETIVIGGGQAGLAVGYYLAQRGLPFVIVDANERIGDSWRNRWDSLRLFTPARFSGLDGMPQPADPHEFVTKDAMADYLEAYAEHFELPVRCGMRVDRLSRPGDRFEVSVGGRRMTADQVVVAMSSYQAPRVPGFATELDPAIVQLHSHEYRNRSQLREGGVLIVGAGNSGAEIAKELAPHHPVWVSGRDVGQLPFRIDGLAGRRFLVRLVLRGLFHRVLTVGTPMGRRMRPKVLTEGGPLIRVKAKDLESAGVRRVGRTAGVQDGRPLLGGGQVLDVANVIWCTGFHPGYSWIDLPVLGEHEPRHERGVVADEPGLYFVGLLFLSSMSSEMIHGVGRDADYIAGRIAERVGEHRRLAVA